VFVNLLALDLFNASYVHIELARSQGLVLLQTVAFFAPLVLQLHQHPLLPACQLQRVSALLAHPPIVPAQHCAMRG
jgi:hypothetical protein